MTAGMNPRRIHPKIRCHNAAYDLGRRMAWTARDVGELLAQWPWYRSRWRWAKYEPIHPLGRNYIYKIRDVLHQIEEWEDIPEFSRNPEVAEALEFVRAIRRGLKRKTYRELHVLLIQLRHFLTVRGSRREELAAFVWTALEKDRDEESLLPQLQRVAAQYGGLKDESD